MFTFILTQKDCLDDKVIRNMNIPNSTIVYVFEKPLLNSVEKSIRNPVITELENEYERFQHRLNSIPKTELLIPIGGTAIYMMEKSLDINKIVGRFTKFRDWDLFAIFTYDLVKTRPVLKDDFITFLRKALTYPNNKQEPQYKILKPLEYVKKCMQIIDWYNKGHIKYVMFDTETTGLKSHKDDLIMFCLGCEMEETGYSAPTFINNNLRPNKKVEKLFDLYKEDLYEIDFHISSEEIIAMEQATTRLLTTVPVSGHNFKFDLKFLFKKHNISPREVKLHADTNIMAYLLYGPGGFGHSNGLKELCVRNLGAPNWERPKDMFLECFKKDESDFSLVPTSMLGKYGALDVYWNIKLLQFLNRKFPSSMYLLHNMLKDLFTIFSEAEVRGVKIDVEYNKKLKKAYSDGINSVISEMRKLPTVKSFMSYETNRLLEKNNKIVNGKLTTDKFTEKQQKEWFEEQFTGTDDQLKVIFFGYRKTDKIDMVDEFGKKVLGSDKKPVKIEKMRNIFSSNFGLPIQKDKEGFVSEKTKAPSIGDDVIDFYLEHYFNEEYMKTAEQHGEVFLKVQECVELLKLVRKLRRYKKLLSTYVESFYKKETIDENNMYHPEFGYISVVTGRGQSGFHTVDKGGDIPRQYISRWRSVGGIIGCSDFSQVELRIGASLANETNMIEAYNKGLDLHRATAAAIHSIPLEEVDKQKRQGAKAINFGIFYGKGVKSIAEDLNCSLEEAQEIYDGFMKANKNLQKWIEHQHSFVRKHGYVVTPFGRQIKVEGWDSEKAWLLAKAERASVNYPVQGTASDCVSWSVIDMNMNGFYKEQLNSVFIGVIHDSLEVDIYPGELFKVLLIQKNSCEKRLTEELQWIKCPMELSVEFGTSWGSATEWVVEELDEDHFVGVIPEMDKGLLKCDVEDLITTLSKAYDVHYEVLETKQLDDSNFKYEIITRDTEKQVIRIFINKKKSVVSNAV